MPKTATVTLAEKSYTLTQKPIKEAKRWREALRKPFGELAATLEGAGNMELTNGADLAGLVQSLSGTLLGSVDILLDLLFSYSPELAADRARIEESAYDDEALGAFTEVLKLVYPFGELLALVNGQPGKPTSSK